MPAAPRDAGRLDPDEAGRREFTRSRKGYDPVEVRAHLLSLAGEIKRLQTVEADLERKVDTLEQRAREHESLDPGAVTRALGDETVRVIDAAHQAATEIRAKAEDNATRLVADAHERANRLTQEATEVRDGAVRDAEQMRSEARVHADELLAEASREAEETRAAAQQDAERWRAEAADVLEARTAEATEASERIRGEAAEAAAEERAAAIEAAAIEVETAREQGREMIQEARDARERILRDLAERRQVARRQLEALRAARERLLESFSAARTALDDATDEIVDALPAARDAADQAARGVGDDIEGEIAELDREASSDGEGRLTGELSETAVGTAAAGDVSAGSNGDVDAAAAAVAPHDGSDAEGDAPSEPSDAAGADDDASGTGSHLRLVDGGDGDDVEEVLGSLDVGAGHVEEIFARLRAAESGDEDEDQDVDVDVDGPVATVTAISDAIDVTGPDAVADDPAADDPAGDEAAVQATLELRDDVIGELDRTVARRLKRVVSDQENAVLDRVRRQRKATSVDALLGEEEPFAQAFVEATVADLTEVAEAGRVFVDRRIGTSVVGDTPGAVSSMAAQVIAWVADPLRTRLARVIEESDDTSPERVELAERLRMVYREWRNDKLAELSGDLTTLAFNLGIRAALPAGATVCWLVDHGGLPCPDAEDNHLAGFVEAGTEFPTGDLAPPAHPGCRCLLAPSPR